MIEIDGLNELVADLSDAPRAAKDGARAVVERGALNVKNDAVRFATGISHAPHYPRSIGYDVSGLGFGDITAEIGPDKTKPQGALGNILEYGTVNNSPRTHLGPALDREGPRFVEALADLGRDVL